MEITRVVKCPLPNFEGVEVEFDLMATAAAVDMFMRATGLNGSHQGVVVKVEGWPAAYGDDPWDAKRVPVVWFSWASKRGWPLAMKEYLEDAF